MRLSLLVVASAVCLATAGCRTNSNVVLLEKELRLQEDDLYRLQEQIETYKLDLKDARRKIASLNTRLEADEDEPRQEVDPGYLPDAVDPIQTPLIELPDEMKFDDFDGGTPDRLPNSNPIEFGPLPEESSINGVSPNDDSVDGSRAVRLDLNGPLTGGNNVDGLPGDEGGFLICTAWLIEAYVMLNQYEDARILFDRYVDLAGHTGLLSEAYEPSTKLMLGNHPQAYSHLGLINAALALHRARP